jgi:uncharacterized protein (TIGR03437 family)
VDLREIVALTGICLLALESAGGAELRIRSAGNLRDRGGRLSWSRAKNVIAYDKLSADGFYDIWVMNPDGSGDQCLTCDKSGVPNLHLGNPDWHPTGNFIVFQGQTRPASNDQNARPGVGNNNDIWIMDAQGQRFWQITQNADAVLHPHFSHAGDKLMWAERLTPLPPNWVIKLADVSIQNGVPVVQNIRQIAPGPPASFYETHCFSPDDKVIYFSANLEPRQPIPGIDQYAYELATGKLTNLTNTPTEWDEHGQISPAGDRIFWLSSMGTNSNPTINVRGLKGEYWIMNPDGSDKIRMTYYNDPLSRDYVPKGLVPGDVDWNADGTRIAAYLIPVDESAALGLEGGIVIYDLEPGTSTLSAASFRRIPVAPDSVGSTFGSGFAKDLTTAATLPPPTTLGGASVTITDSAGTARLAPLFFVAPGQVNFLVPATTAAGPALITMKNAEGVEFRGNAYIESLAPALFTQNANGQGVAAAIAVRVSQDGSQTTTFVADCAAGSGRCITNPIDLGAPGEQNFLLLFGTGIRARASIAGVRFLIGNQETEILYAGPQGVYPGLDQVNVRLPRSLTGAGIIETNLLVDGKAANTVQLQIR